MGKRTISKSNIKDSGAEKTKRVKPSQDTDSKKVKKSTFTPDPEILEFQYKDWKKYAQQFPSSLKIKEKKFNPQQSSLTKSIASLSKKEKIEPKDFIALDKYFFRDNVSDSSTIFSQGINLNMLSLVMNWKLMRGKFRPRLSTLVTENSEKQVLETTKVCFTELFEVYGNYKRTKQETESFIDIYREEIKKWTKNLSTLRGVGPATASALLSMACPEIPFMSDEGLNSSGDSKPAYSLKTYDMYLDFISFLFLKVNASSSEEVISPRDIERALFAKFITKHSQD